MEVDNIKMHVREIRYGCIDWINMAQDRDWLQVLVNSVINL
jgi:hypothetical protein